MEKIFAECERQIDNLANILAKLESKPQIKTLHYFTPKRKKRKYWN